jgi:CRISPR-associated protein Csm5
MTLTMLSPVHIGSGEEIDPVEYIVTEEQRGADTYWFLHALDLPALLARLTEDQRRQFNAAADRNALFYLRKFVAGVADLRRDIRWKAACSGEVYDAYRAGLESDAAQLIINLMTRDAATGQAYIPGSSIKGALRTAWVNHKAAVYAGPERLDRISEGEFEPEVLGYRVSTGHRPRAEIRADPFRAVHVGDARLCDDSNTIEDVEIHRPQGRGGPDPSGIRMYYDATFSALDGERITAEGRLQVDERLARTPARSTRGRWDFQQCVAEGVEAGALLQACNDLYRPRLEDELGRFPRLADVRDKLLAEGFRPCPPSFSGDVLYPNGAWPSSTPSRPAGPRRTGMKDRNVFCRMGLRSFPRGLL